MFWQGKKAENLCYYFCRKDSRCLFVSDSWHCQIHTTRLIMFLQLYFLSRATGARSRAQCPLWRKSATMQQTILGTIYLTIYLSIYLSIYLYIVEKECDNATNNLRYYLSIYLYIAEKECDNATNNLRYYLSIYLSIHFGERVRQCH